MAESSPIAEEKPVATLLGRSAIASVTLGWRQAVFLTLARMSPNYIQILGP